MMVHDKDGPIPKARGKLSQLAAPNVQEDVQAISRICPSQVIGEQWRDAGLDANPLKKRSHNGSGTCSIGVPMEE